MNIFLNTAYRLPGYVTIQIVQQTPRQRILLAHVIAVKEGIKMFKSTVCITLAFASSLALAAPSESECAVTEALDSPTATFFKLPMILANPVSAFVFAASSYRAAQCPRPKLLTRDEAEKMIQRALAQYAECLAGGCPKTVYATNEGGRDE